MRAFLTSLRHLGLCLAAAWLVARQNPDGTWGSETGRLWRTSVALVALAASPGRHSDAVARAAMWLDAQPAAGSNLYQHAWRLLAVCVAIPGARAGSSPPVARLVDAASPLLEGSPAETAQALWREALALAGLAPPPVASPLDRHMLVYARGAWPKLAEASPFYIWPYARAINRTGGVLDLDGVRLDWRRDVARSLVNSQRRDPAGGGYWGTAVDGDDRLLHTAFGLLTAHEL